MMMNPERVPEARATCAECPVADECRTWGIITRQPVGVLGGLTWMDRLLYCPICLGPKRHLDLGCSAAHSLRVLAEFIRREADGDEDYKVSRRAMIYSRTNPECPVPNGSPHATMSAYTNGGCRCKEGLIELRRHTQERLSA